MDRLFAPTLCKVTRLIKHVVVMVSHPTSAEHGREAHVGIHLVLGYHLVAAFGLADSKFANL